MPTDHQLEVAIQPEVSPLRAVVTRRNLIFAAIVGVSLVAFLDPVRRLIALSQTSDEYSYLALIPVIVAGLFYIKRRSVFLEVHYSLRAGIPLIASGAAAGCAGMLLTGGLTPDVSLFFETLGLVLACIGAFVLCYGTAAARRGLFPVLFSLLVVPIPEVLMAKPIALVQHGSADVTAFLFTLTGLPVFRNGLTFSLPRLTFVVATECSGIHSTTALFIASLLAGHFCCKAAWQKGLLVALVLPIICFTNGLRMFILAVLAVYVDRAFFFGNLHKKGGIFFFALALVILAVIIKLLRRPWRGRPTPRLSETQA
ncbi:MAG: exosortase/archaeosortase family protein [Terriglobia bacterium]